MCAVFFALNAACGEPEPPAEREPALSAETIRTAGADFTHEYVLDNVQKKMYDTLAESMKSPSEEILIYEYKGDHMDFLLKDALVAMTCYTMDNPLDSQLLANRDIRMEAVPKSGGRNRIYAYRREDSDGLELAMMKRADAESVSRHFISTISALDDEEKLRAIHDRLCQGQYDTDITPASHTIYSALIDKSAVCDGYAYAFKYLCDLAGIDCVVVIGTFDKSNDGELGHAWDLVWLGGTWKLADISCDVYEAPSYEHFLIDDLTIDGRIPYKAYPVPMYKEYQ
ncbi:MAG: transglutaminase domain-containing protein [Ruminococcus sp.]|nr:transglutaminase domain-containing protein [Ruminococcus sp.]